MKRFIFYLLVLSLLSPLFSQGTKEEGMALIKDDIYSIEETKTPSFSLELYNEDKDVKDKILSIDTSSVSPTLLLRHSSKDGKAYIEYGSDYLNYSLSIESNNVELKVSEEGALLYLNGKQVGEKTLSENILIFENAFLGINEILSSPEDFVTTEIRRYKGENWESTLSWIVGERRVEAEIIYTDSNSSLWRITGYIEKDKITDALTPLNIFMQPYFTLLSVEKDGEKRAPVLW